MRVNKKFLVVLYFTSKNEFVYILLFASDTLVNYFDNYFFSYIYLLLMNKYIISLHIYICAPYISSKNRFHNFWSRFIAKQTEKSFWYIFLTYTINNYIQLMACKRFVSIQSTRKKICYEKFDFISDIVI